MSSAAELHVLTTSRAPLRIRGEIEHAVPALTAGDPHATDPQLPGAVALFLARAQEIQPAFEVTDETGPLVAAICNRLDGLPLAIELAASRLRLFPLATLAERLGHRLPLLTGGSRDLPERQQGLRATIAWSDELLAPGDRDLFHRLGVFAGSFSLDGATAVAEPGADVEAGLTTLLEQSLIHRLENPYEPRFAMLETIREFAVDALTADERLASHDGMTDFVCAVASRSREDLVGQRQAATLRLMDDELPNIRATLKRLQEAGDRDRLPTLVADLARFWLMRGLRREGRRWIEIAEPLVTDQGSNVRGRLYRALAMMIVDDDYLKAKDAVERAIAIHRARGDTRDLAGCLLSLSLIGNGLRQFDITIAASTEAAALAQEIGDARTEGAARGNLAQALLMQGNIDEAEAGFAASNVLLRQIGDNHGVAQGTGALALLARARGDLAEAVRLHREAAAAFADLGDPTVEAVERLNLAMALAMVADGRAAAIELLRGLALGEATDDDLVKLAALSIGGSALHTAGDVSGAAWAWASSKVLSEQRGFPIDPLDRDEASFAKVRQELGPAYDEIEHQAKQISLDGATSVLAVRLRAVTEAPLDPDSQ
jgi:non-specific serine/threonine protein kinase